MSVILSNIKPWAISSKVKEVLEDNPSLTSLTLNNNDIDVVAIGQIVSLIANNSTIKLLSLKSNSLDSHSCTHLAQLLQENTTITHLDLVGNKLGDDGVNHLIQGLEKNHSLTSLDLQSTGFGLTGAGSIALALKYNTSITSLSLADNYLSSEGIWIMMFLLKYCNNTIKSLDIDLETEQQKNILGSLLYFNKDTPLCKYKRYIPYERLEFGPLNCMPYIRELIEAKANYKSIKVCIFGGNETGVVPLILQGATQRERPAKGVNISYHSNIFEGVDVSLWDLPTKQKYKTTHTCLLSRKSVYLLCFELNDIEHSYNMITTWIKWLHTLLGPHPNSTKPPPLYKILLVGIYHDQEEPSLFDGRFQDLCTLFPSTPIHEEYVCVNTKMQNGREHLIKTITHLCKSVLRENTEFDIPIAYREIVQHVPRIRQAFPFIEATKLREELEMIVGGFGNETFENLLYCLDCAGEIVSYDGRLVFMDPNLAALALSTFICPKTEHVLHSQGLPSLGILTTSQVSEVLLKASLPFTFTTNFLESTGLCVSSNDFFYFPRMIPTTGVPQFKSPKKTHASVTGIRFFVSASNYVISLKLFCKVQLTLLKSLTQDAPLDFTISRHRVRILSKEKKGELLLELDRNQLQMHLFVCNFSPSDLLLSHAKQQIETILFQEYQSSKIFSTTSDNIVKDFAAMQKNPMNQSKLSSKKTNSELADIVIPFYILQLGDTIGQGGFGKVKTAVYKDRVVAVKQLNVMASKLSPFDLEKFKDEIKAMRSINSDYVVKLYGACTEPKLAIVMEYLEGGDLSSLLLNSQFDLSWSLRLSFACDIAAGISALHKRSPPMLHCDIKAANVLLDKNRKNCKLADFGLATMKASHSRSIERGTLKWMSPEILCSQPMFSIYSDMYAFGMVLWEIASRQQPFNAISDDTIKFAIKTQEREEIPEGCPEGYKELIERCWEETPGERPTAEEALDILREIKRKVLPDQDEEEIETGQEETEENGPNLSTSAITASTNLYTLESRPPSLPSLPSPHSVPSLSEAYYLPSAERVAIQGEPACENIQLFIQIEGEEIKRDEKNSIEISLIASLTRLREKIASQLNFPSSYKFLRLTGTGATPLSPLQECIKCVSTVRDKDFNIFVRIV